MKNQHGAAMVEFAISALFFFMVLFSAFEVGRLMLNLNMLNEVARRGARIAAVCPYFDDYIKIAAVFGVPGQKLPQNSPLVAGLSTNDITIDYYGIDAKVSGSTVTPSFVCLASSPDTNCGGDGTITADDALGVRFVQVGVTYHTDFIAPVIWKLFQNYSAPTFKTMLPRESLGDQQTTNNHCYLPPPTP